MTPSALPLGAFSVSLKVASLEASRAFYEALGFSVFAGSAAHKWLILRNGAAKIGLFEGHIPANTLTFNPGWDGDGQPVPDFVDVRELQRRLAAAGIAPTVPVDEATSGPGFVLLTDPDGNPVLLDQHV